MELCVTSKIHTVRSDGSSVPFSECVFFAREAGFTQMDYSFSAKRLIKDGWKETALDEWKTARDAGIRFRYSHLPYDYPKSPDEWNSFFTASCRAIELSCLFGVECAAIHPRTFMRRDYNEDREREDALAFLRPYCDEAKAQNLTLALEIMRGAGKSADPEIRRFATDTNDLLFLAETMDTGICWDTGHANISLQEQYPSIMKVKKRLKMLHVNDNFAEDDVHLAPYLGNVDWNGVVRALREIGFTGAVNLEVNCNGRPDEAKKEYAAYMAAAAKKIRDGVLG